VVGNGARVCLTCVANGNTYMSHDALNRCRKSRTTKRGSPLADARHRVGRRRHGSIARFRVIASSSLSLPRRGSGDRPSCSHRRTVGSHHAEDSGQRRSRSAQLFGSQRNDAWRNCRACHLEVPQGNAPAWLRAAREESARSVSTTRLIVCSPRNSSRSTRFWFPTKCALSAIALR